MAYLVLARKYRPTSFADIIGQEHVVRTLCNAIRADRVHHAFLFSGARGVGKTTTARVSGPGPELRAGAHDGALRDVCRLARRSLAAAVPMCSRSTVRRTPASTTCVSCGRASSYLPSRGRFKIYIIDEVHMLSQAAFNALLKTLEEPPAHVKFIFATTEPHKIPVTILSRCQRFDFRRVSDTALSEHLRARSGG